MTLPIKPKETANVESKVDATPAAFSVRWSSHPIQRYSIGEFQFENALLVLDSEEAAAKFEALRDSLPIHEQTRTTKIDLAAAEKLVLERLGLQPVITKGIDSATGDRAPNKAVGTGTLGDRDPQA